MHRHRCISLSLSLSLCSGCSSAANGAHTDLLAASRRAPERGFSAAWRSPLASLACARVFVLAPSGWRGASRSRTQGAWRAAHASDRGRRDAPPIVVLNLGCPPYNPWRISEEAPSRVPSRAGSVGPKRRGLLPNRRPRRSLFHHLGQAGLGENLRVLRCLGLFEHNCNYCTTSTKETR